MNTDHAEDQKKLVRLIGCLKELCERETRGEKVLLSKSVNESLPLLLTMRNKVIQEAGGSEVWNGLSEVEQSKLNERVYRELCIQLGHEDFGRLSSTEKEVIDFFVWAGCCMHKDLNAVKGGATQMAKYWAETGLTGPMKLMNKDNAAASTMGSSAAKKRAEEVSQAGAMKLTSLAGSIFNHKDDKKGQHDSLKYYFTLYTGCSIDFPDTSNTRYQSHCSAAAELIANRPLYIRFLVNVRDRKETMTFTNIKQNVYNGLHDIPTLAKLIILIVYSQAICHPYLRVVRCAKQTNALDLGPLHQQVKEHIRKMINDPSLVLLPGALHETGTMNGTQWEHPEAMYAAWSLMGQPNFPKLDGLLRAFLEGALETWERLTEEYRDGGVIAKSSAEQRRLAHLDPTNDCNEGGLGGYRRSKRHSQNESLAYYNARTMYKANSTSEYVSSTLEDSETQKFLRRKAREIGASGMSRKL